MVDASGIPRRVTETTPAQKHNDLARRVEQQGSARRLESASIGKGGLTIRDGGKLIVDGDAQINGTLSLPKGIIDNDALSSPITTGSAGLTQQGFAVGSTGSTFAVQAIPVPDGYSKAIVMNGVSGSAWNTTSSLGYLYVASMINGSPGGEVVTPATGPGTGSATAFGVRTLSGLTPGSVITVGVYMRVGAGAWGASASNAANTNAIALFLR